MRPGLAYFFKKKDWWMLQKTNPNLVTFIGFMDPTSANSMKGLHHAVLQQ